MENLKVDKEFLRNNGIKCYFDPNTKELCFTTDDKDEQVECCKVLIKKYDDTLKMLHDQLMKNRLD